MRILENIFIVNVRFRIVIVCDKTTDSHIIIYLRRTYFGRLVNVDNKLMHF